MLKFDPADFEKMKGVENALRPILERANRERVEAALAAFACVRLAREIIDNYPPNTRHQLTELMSAFLTRSPVEHESEPGHILLQ